MSAVIATPELMAQAATDLASIGSSLNAVHMVAAAPTLSVLPAAADEVSAGIARLFSGYAHDYHALAGKAAAFQDQFVQHLTAGAGAYASAEAANVTSLLKPLTAIAAPVAAAATAAQNTLFDLAQTIFVEVYRGVENAAQILYSLPFGPVILALLVAPFVFAVALVVLPVLLLSAPFLYATLTAPFLPS